MLMQAMTTARMLPEHSVRRSSSPDDGAGDASPLTSISEICCPDEAPAVQRLVTVEPPSARPHRWRGPALALAPSPAPDEILHVPKTTLA